MLLGRGGLEGADGPLLFRLWWGNVDVDVLLDQGAAGAAAPESTAAAAAAAAAEAASSADATAAESTAVSSTDATTAESTSVSTADAATAESTADATTSVATSESTADSTADAAAGGAVAAAWGGGLVVGVPRGLGPSERHSGERQDLRKFHRDVTDVSFSFSRLKRRLCVYTDTFFFSRRDFFLNGF